MTKFKHGKKAIDEYVKHIRNEVRPHAEQNGYSRSDTLEASLNAVRKHFENAWPKES